MIGPSLIPIVNYMGSEMIVMPLSEFDFDFNDLTSYT